MIALQCQKKESNWQTDSQMSFTWIESVSQWVKMQSITLMLSSKHCHGQSMVTKSLNQWVRFWSIDKWLWVMAHFHYCYLGYCLTHWLKISYDKQLSNAKAWSQIVVCETLDLSISLHAIITYYLIDWPASLIQYTLLLALHSTQDLNPVWFICRQFDSKCQVKSAAGHLLD